LSTETIIKILSKSFERVAEFRCLGTSLKITNAKPRRIRIHGHKREKIKCNIAASQLKVLHLRLGSKLQGVRRAQQNITQLHLISTSFTWYFSLCCTQFGDEEQALH
jgi:hypothetical protein